MARVLVACVVSLVCAAAAAASPQPQATAARRPWNVLLITVDALRADRMSLYGNPRPTTPQLDAFAREAAVFENAFAVSAHTSPGVVSLLTGMEPPVHAQTTQHSFYDAELPSPLRALAARGYDLVGYSTRGATYADLGFTAGLDRAAPEEFLAARAGEERPFLAWLHARDTHLPYAPPPEIAGRFTRGRPLASPLLRAVQEHAMVLRDGAVEIPYRHAGPIAAAEGDAEALRALYDEAVASADARVGGWLRTLRESGQLERTLVVITADHGEELLEHGWVGHASTSYDGKLTDEVLRVPLIVRVPGALYAGRYRALVSQVDVMPTVLALLHVDAGALAPLQQGVSLLPVLSGARAEVREEVFAETTRKGWTTPREEAPLRVRALRTRDRKLIVTPGQGGEGERVDAYDLIADPREQRSLWPAESARFEDLRGRLARLASRHEGAVAALVFGGAAHHQAEAERALARDDFAAVEAHWRALQNLHLTWGLERAPFYAADAHQERWRARRIALADLFAAALRCEARGLPLADAGCRAPR